MNRDMCGMYFRVKNKEGKYSRKCLSDCTEGEIELILKDKSTPFLISTIKILCNTIQDVGDRFDIITKYEEKEDE